MKRNCLHLFLVISDIAIVFSTFIRAAMVGYSLHQSRHRLGPCRPTANLSRWGNDSESFGRRQLERFVPR